MSETDDHASATATWNGKGKVGLDGAVDEVMEDSDGEYKEVGDVDD